MGQCAILPPPGNRWNARDTNSGVGMRYRFPDLPELQELEIGGLRSPTGSAGFPAGSLSRRGLDHPFVHIGQRMRRQTILA